MAKAMAPANTRRWPFRETEPTRVDKLDGGMVESVDLLSSFFSAFSRAKLDAPDRFNRAQKLSTTLERLAGQNGSDQNGSKEKSRKRQISGRFC